MGLIAGMVLIGRDLLADVTFGQTPSVLEGVVVKSADRLIEVSTVSGRWVVDCFENCVGFVGDEVHIDGERRLLDPKRIDSAFDYDRYLQSIGIRGRFRSSHILVTGHRFHPAIVRDAFFGYVDDTLRPTTAAMIRYALFGDSSAMEDDVVATVRKTGIAHLFAVSGLHLTLMVGFLKNTWNRLFWREDRFVFLLVVFLLVYNLLTGWTPSLVRASLFSLVAAFPAIKGRLSNTDWLTLIGLMMLIWNPALSSHVGFQLSFLATAGIYLFAEKESSTLSGMLRMATMASLVTLPLIVSMQGEISLWVVFASVAFGWAMTRGLLPATILTLLIPPLQSLYGILADGFLLAIDWLNSINVAVPLTLTGIYWLFYWLALLPCLARFSQRKPWISQAALLLGVVVASQWLRPMVWVPRVEVLDVNQGDAIWIETPKCKMLIDTGDVDAYDTVLNSLLRKGIRHMDVLLITHRHADHDGELSDLTESIRVDRVILGRMPEVPMTTNDEIAQAGQVLVCGDLRFDVLSGERGAANENDNSLVIKANIGGDNWLFMADAELAVEREVLSLLDESVDVLKVGHHGGKTSTGLALLQVTQPKIAILSVGRPNRFGHPHDEVLRRLEEQAIDVYRTDRDGSISVWSVGSFRVIQTARNSTDRIWNFPQRIRIEHHEKKTPQRKS